MLQYPTTGWAALNYTYQGVGPTLASCVALTILPGCKCLWAPRKQAGDSQKCRVGLGLNVRAISMKSFVK